MAGRRGRRGRGAAKANTIPGIQTWLDSRERARKAAARKAEASRLGVTLGRLGSLVGEQRARVREIQLYRNPPAPVVRIGVATGSHRKARQFPNPGTVAKRTIQPKRGK